MVTTRGASDFASLQRVKSLEWFTKFGRSDITWRVNTNTFNSAGRLTGQSSSDTTIIGDLQFDFKILRDLIEIGYAKTGDAIFYTVYNHAISVGDEIIVDGITWRLRQQIEAEQTNGSLIYQGWVCRRSP